MTFQQNIFGLIIFFILSSCQSVFYYPDNLEYLTPEKIGLSYENFFIKDRLHVWRVPSITQPSLGCVVHFHGNAQNMSAHIFFSHWFAFAGFDLITFDYQGYGRSKGSPSRTELLKDAVDIMDYAQGSCRQFFIFAQSLGGAVVVPAAAFNPPKNLKGLIIDSSFSAYRSVVRAKLAQIWLTWPLQYPLSFIISDKLSPYLYAPDIRLPVLVIHSSDDLIVPFSQGLDLWKSFVPFYADFWKVQNLNHLETFVTKDSAMIYRKKLLEWMKNL